MPPLLVAAALLYGTVGFLLIDRVDIFDALYQLYQTVLVLSTSGFLAGAAVLTCERREDSA